VPKTKSRTPASGRVRIIPLGGLGEIGKNATVIQTDRDLILVDAGVKFPEEEMHGVDLVIPDFSYLISQRARLRGIVLTHSHEDHIGGLPYLLQQLGTRVPVFGTRLTLGMVTGKLKERRVLQFADLSPIEPGTDLALGKLSIQFIPVGHSIPDAVALAIRTPCGTIVHSGDFKLGHPGESEHDALRDHFARIGQSGVLVLLSECVGVERPGRTPPESIVVAALEHVMQAAPGRVIVSTFASNIGRLNQIIEIAGRLGRRVTIAGRSMENNVRVAGELGFLPSSSEVLVSTEAARSFLPNQIVYLVTGSQGEPTAALARIAANDHPHIRIVPGDTVIVSASPIPGNEEAFAQTIDNLFRRGARVVYKAISPDIHVSGHASRDELGELIQTVRPRFCVPLHGEYRMLVLYRDLAIAEGIPPGNVLLADNGDVLEFTATSARKDGSVPAGSVLVDGLTVGGVTQVVLRDRGHLAEDGILIATVLIDRTTGELIREPEIVSRGFVDDTGADVLADARRQIKTALKRARAPEPEYGFLIEKIKETLGQLVYRKTRKRPMILPLVTEV